jgi:hypothetical protein
VPPDGDAIVVDESSAAFGKKSPPSPRKSFISTSPSAHYPPPRCHW